LDISTSMVRYYMDAVTIPYFKTHDAPPRNLDGYLPQLLAMKRKLTVNKDEDALKLACEHIIGNPHIDASQLAGGGYAFSENEIRVLIRYVWQQLWPEAPAVKTGGPLDVKLVPMSLEDWRASRKAAAAKKNETSKTEIPKAP
jgi:hypothetical protein